MVQEAIKEGMEEMDTADRLTIDAVSRMREANIDPAFGIIAMFHHGVVSPLTDLEDSTEQRHILDNIDNYVRNAREILGVPAHKSFLE